MRKIKIEWLASQTPKVFFRSLFTAYMLPVHRVVGKSLLISFSLTLIAILQKKKKILNWAWKSENELELVVAARRRLRACKLPWVNETISQNKIDHKSISMATLDVFFLHVQNVHRRPIVHHLGLKKPFLFAAFPHHQIITTTINYENIFLSVFRFIYEFFIKLQPNKMFSLSWTAFGGNDGKFLLAHNMQVRGRLIVLLCKRRLMLMLLGYRIMIYEYFAWEEEKFPAFSCHVWCIRYVVNFDFHNLINFHSIKKFCAIQPQWKLEDVSKKAIA